MKYSHDEILIHVDRALLKVLEEVIDEDKSTEIKVLLKQKRYELVRRVNVSPKKGVSLDRPDIWYFNGQVIVEVKTSQAEFEQALSQLRKYVQQFFKDTARYCIITDGLNWDIRDANLERVALVKVDEKAYEAGELEGAITSSEELREVLMKVFSEVDIGVEIDPPSISKVFSPVLGYTDFISRLLEGYKGHPLYLSYKDIMLRLYSGLKEEEVTKLYAIHTLLQMVVNSVLSKTLNKDITDPLKACSGELLQPYETSLPQLVWWNYGETRQLVKPVCDEIVSYLYIFNWGSKPSIDVFSHLYEDFVEKSLRYKVGEYYTPWWLTELALKELKEMGAPIRDGIVLDPSCGSGRFLVSAFYKKVKEEGKDPDEAYYEIVGIDINPLAVALARAELIISYIYLQREKEGIFKFSQPKLPPGTPLIFWGDFIGPVVKSYTEVVKELKQIMSSVTNPLLRTALIDKVRKLKKSDALKAVMLFEVVISEYLSKGEIRACKKVEEGDRPLATACEIASNFASGKVSNYLKELVKKYNDHVWGIPITSSLFIDVFLPAIQPEVVVTNPPWLVINTLPKGSKWTEGIRDYVKKSLLSGVKVPGTAVSKGDVSAVFLDVILSLIPGGGYVSIVLPAGQSYSGFSTSHGAGKLLTFRVMKRWDTRGEIVYLGDVFDHGIPASLAVLKKGERFDVRCKSVSVRSGKDSHLDRDLSLKDDGISIEDHVLNVGEYLEKSREIRLNGIEKVRLEGDVISPTFSGGPTSSTRKDVIPLTVTVRGYDETTRRAAISPLGSKGSVTYFGKVEWITSWYIPLKVIYPFTIVRAFKLITKRETLEELYKGWEGLSDTLRVLKIPKRPTIGCEEKANLLLYRNQRTFVSAVITQEVLEDMCKKSDGVFIDHHVVVLESKDKDVVYYYSAVLNYMVHKVKELELGGFNRDQFGRPIKAMLELGLEWRGEEWQKKVSELSKSISSNFREKVLAKMKLNPNLPI